MSYSIDDFLGKDEKLRLSLLLFANKESQGDDISEYIIVDGKGGGIRMPGTYLIKGRDGKWFIQSKDRQWHEDKILFERHRDAFEFYFYVITRSMPSMYDYRKKWEAETGLQI